MLAFMCMCRRFCVQIVGLGVFRRHITFAFHVLQYMFTRQDILVEFVQGIALKIDGIHDFFQVAYSFVGFVDFRDGGLRMR
jgi:hypothetical protein